MAAEIPEATETTEKAKITEVVILGAGYAGMLCANRLRASLDDDEAQRTRITFPLGDPDGAAAARQYDRNDAPQERRRPRGCGCRRGLRRLSQPEWARGELNPHVLSDTRT